MASPAFEEIAETFEFLDDWEDRYRHVIELGRAMPPLDAAFRVPATKVRAARARSGSCRGSTGSGPAARFDFQGDSDAMIVRGLIAILHALYGGLTVAEVGAGGCTGRTGAAGADRSPVVAAVERAARDGGAHPVRAAAAARGEFSAKNQVRAGVCAENSLARRARERRFQIAIAGEAPLIGQARGARRSPAPWHPAPGRRSAPDRPAWCSCRNTCRAVRGWRSRPIGRQTKASNCRTRKSVR